MENIVYQTNDEMKENNLFRMVSHCESIARYCDLVLTEPKRHREERCESEKQVENCCMKYIFCDIFLEQEVLPQLCEAVYDVSSA